MQATKIFSPLSQTNFSFRVVLTWSSANTFDWTSLKFYRLVSSSKSLSSDTSNLVCVKEVAIKSTFSHMINIAGIIYDTCSVVIDIQCTPCKTFLTNCVSIFFLITGVCNPFYFRLCIDLMHINPPVTAEGSMAPSTRGLLNLRRVKGN